MSDHLLYLLSQTNVDKELTIPNVQWMDDIAPLNDFFEWMSNCVSDRNCITSDELRMFEILKKEDKLIDEATLKEELDTYFPGSMNVYPHQNDIDLLENMTRKAELQNAQLVEYKKKIEYQINSIKKRKKCRQVESLEGMELQKLRNRISGEYRCSLNSFATNFRLLNSKISASIKAPSSNLLSQGSLEKCCRQYEYLKHYVINLVNIFENALKRDRSGSYSNGTDEFYDTNFTVSNLRAVYNTCVMMKIEQVKTLAEIEGIEASMNLLDQDLLLHFSVTSRSAEEIEKIEADVAATCKEQVDALMREIELELSKNRKEKNEEILSKLNELKDVAMPLKLCEESILILLKNEWKWIVFAKDLLSESRQFIDDLHENIQEMNRNISYHETLSQLSCVVTPDSGISSVLIKLFDGQPDSLHPTGVNKSSMMSFSTLLSQQASSALEGEMIENYVVKQYHAKIGEFIASMKNVSSDALNVMAMSKMVYNHVFPGPAATPCLHTKFEYFKSAVINNEERLNSAKEKLAQAHYRYYDLKLLRQVQPGTRIQDMFWLYYRQDPIKLEQAVLAITKESEVFKQYHKNVLEENLRRFLDDIN